VINFYRQFSKIIQKKKIRKNDQVEKQINSKFKFLNILFKFVFEFKN